MTTGGVFDNKSYTDCRRIIYKTITNDVNILAGHEIVVEIEPAQPKLSDVALADKKRKCIDNQYPGEVVSQVERDNRMQSVKRVRPTV